MADAGRVIAGRARGTRLGAAGPATRPLADRVKQTLFAILEPDLPGARFLDLFAGSGAAGIEALSRGVAHATFVERDAAALSAIRTNLERTRFGPDRATVAADDVVHWLRRDRTGRAMVDHAFDIVVLDPPYGEPAILVAALESVAPLVAGGGRVVAKHFWRDPPPPVIGLLASERERRFGETALTFYRRTEAG